MIRASGDIKLLLHTNATKLQVQQSEALVDLLRVNDAILNVVGYLVQYDLGYGLLMRLTVHNL